MDEKKTLEAIQELRKTKKNFKQTFDLIINLKDIDIKKTDNKINFYQQIKLSKPKKICALVDTELAEEAKKYCDHTIRIEDFPKYTDKKQAKKLANSYDYFIAQANIMMKIAQTFGKTFGPRGKMPNPKAGCVVPPKANLEPIVEKLRNTIHIQTKNDATLRIPVGTEDSSDKEVIQTIKQLYDSIIHHLPREENNIKNVMLKLTMSKPIRLW